MSKTKFGSRQKLEQSLPKFGNPPVVETVLGLQFENLTILNNAALGVFWSELGDDWPKAEDAPVIVPQFEQFGESEAWGHRELLVNLGPIAPCRIKIRNLSQNRLIQLQNGRLHYNWIAKKEEGYPHYEAVRSEFDTTLSTFEKFVSARGDHNINWNQWEVTYRNHIPKGTVWDEPRDWSDLFPSLNTMKPELSDAHLSSVQGEWHFDIEDDRGRLHVSLQHAKQQDDDGDELLVLMLTARGPTKSFNTNGLTWTDGLNLGHQVIVKSFFELTSAKAHEYWELKT